MDPSKKVKICKTVYSFVMILLAAALVVTAVVTSLLLGSANGSAFADGVSEQIANDTFSVHFPYNSINYVQSHDPTLIAANGTYLIIYDKTARTMFVRGGRIGTYAFPLELDKNVSYIKVVGNTAFIHAEGDNYTVDLKDTASLPKKIELTSPQNANYFRSDGKYLYAKNGDGAVSIYDENLNIADFDGVTVDNYKYTDETDNPVFAGNIVIAGNDHLLYFFPNNFGDPYLVVYDPVTKKELAHELMQLNIREAYVGENIIVGQLSRSDNEAQNTRLVGIDKTTGKTLFPSDIAPDSFCVYGNRLFTIEGKQIKTYTLESNASGAYTGFRNMSTISMSGNDASHLDNPSDLISFGKDVAVADTLNNRVGFINAAFEMTAVALPASPVRLAADQTGVFALCKDGSIIKVENLQALPRTAQADGVLDITYLDKLYLLRGDGLYTLLGGETLKLTNFSGAKRLTAAKDGSNLYVLKDDCVQVYSTNGTLISTLAQELTDAVDIYVDYAGQIFILREDGFDVYANDRGELVLASSEEFYNKTANATANSFTIDGKSLYFSTAECLIGKSDTVSYSKDNFISAPYYPSENASYSFAKLKQDTDSFIIPADGRIEAISAAPAETVLVLDGDDNGWSYALLNGVFFKIRTADYQTVQVTAQNGDYAAKCNTNLYSLPGVESAKLPALAGTRFTLIGDCADFEGSKWLRVSYYDKCYFVLAQHCDEYVELIPEEQKQYGRAKAKRVGGLVSVYAEQSDGSQVLAQIVDGTKIEVLERLDRFYLVKYENTVGYMLKTQVQTEGLTTVQIAAIVVACIVAVAGVGIFIAIEFTKKKALEAERKASKR